MTEPKRTFKHPKHVWEVMHPDESFESMKLRLGEDNYRSHPEFIPCVHVFMKDNERYLEEITQFHVNTCRRY
jgi:hypothetical protein